METRIFIGVLKDKSDNLAVVRNLRGQEQLFWIPKNVPCRAQRDQLVKVTFREEGENQVKNALSLTLL